MGAQSEYPARPNYDPAADNSEGPPFELWLAPFFLSKYEMTSGQWLRFTGANPSEHLGESLDLGYTLRHPVEQVSWEDCDRVLRHMGLVLPTEARWEYAARAGTTTPWSTGAERDSLAGAVNLADQAAGRLGADWSEIAEWPELDDGFTATAPVGSFRPNPFGLYDVHGNVAEWCLDPVCHYARITPRHGDGLRTRPEVRGRCLRGGSMCSPPQATRCSVRSGPLPDQRSFRNGVRPARRVWP
jgi:formylglycine-generating enzyme required for sulfatase activity